MGWHCSRVSAPKRSAKIISAQIKLWPLPGRPGISALLICLSNETPAHREPSGSPPHTDVNVLAHTDANTQTQTPRHPHCHVHAPSCTLASHGEFVAVQFISVERERPTEKPPGVSFLFWTSQINTLPLPLLLPITAAHTHLNHLYLSKQTHPYTPH